MIKPFSLFVGLRYTRAKRRHHFASFISVASVIGIALGVMVLITVLSVMNGYNQVVREKFFAVAPQVTVYTPKDSPRLQVALNKRPDILQTAPFLSGKGMLVVHGESVPAQVMGIDPTQEKRLSSLAKKVTEGSLQVLGKKPYRIAIGYRLAEQLGVGVGDTLMLLTPQTTVTPLGMMPRYRRFVVGAVFATHSGFGFDRGVVYISLADAKRIFIHPDFGSQGYHLSIRDVYAAPEISRHLTESLPAGNVVTNWTEQYGSLFKAIGMQKTIMFAILVLLVAIAAFNLISSLVMIVNEKRSDIAILRTLGASPATIMWIFIAQGAVLGAVGVIVGVIGGVILSLNITDWVNALQHFLGVRWVSEDVYWVDYLPSALRVTDIVLVAVIAFGMSVLATLYPASLAFRTQPAEALRYE